MSVVGEGRAAPRAWYVDVADGNVEAELAFLKSEIYRLEIDLLVRRIEAHDRF
jgi:DNA polymerase-3 subunit epsilon